MHRIVQGKNKYDQEVFYIEEFISIRFLWWKSESWKELRSYWQGGEDSIGTRIEFKELSLAEEFMHNLKNPVADKVIKIIN